MGLKAGLNLIQPTLQKLKYVKPTIEYKSFVNSEQFTGDIAKFSQRLISGKAVSIKTIQTEEELRIILEELIQDSSYKWKRYENIFDYEKAIIPYAGRGDIHKDINTFLREGILPEDKTYTELNSENIKKYIQILEYGLRQLDNEYGNYGGIVYRYGPFSSVTPNYVSTSDKLSGAMYVADKSNPCKEAYHIILEHGHMIKEMQRRLGYKFAETESEILLDPSKSYTELVDNTPQISKLREQFFREFAKTYPGCNSKDIKLNFWKENRNNIL